MSAKSLYGLVGYPLNHSLSPFMHNTAFAALGVPADYRLFPLKEEELKPFFTDLRDHESPIFGVNVTVPYKEKVIPLLDNLAPFARQTGAVNTVTINKKRQLTGHNTDGPGFLAHLQQLGFSLKNKRVALLGAGGASRALIGAMCLFDERPDSIRIFDVDRPKGEALVKDLATRINVEGVSVVGQTDDLNLELADLLINATPVGLKSSDPCLVPAEKLHPNMLVYDLIYNPRETALLRAGKERGAKVSNGQGMLFYQGVLAFEHWAEIQLPQDVKEKMLKALWEGKVL